MFADPPKIRPGSIHILPNCPPLHGDVLKDRPVDVVGVSAVDPQVVIVAISSQVTRSVQDRSRLPDLTTQPQSRSGLCRPSWAVPEWYMLVAASSLGAEVGHISGPLLKRLANAVIDRINTGHPPIQ